MKPKPKYEWWRIWYQMGSEKNILLDEVTKVSSGEERKVLGLGVHDSMLVMASGFRGAAVRGKKQLQSIFPSCRVIMCVYDFLFPPKKKK